jgi:hypothetical protein
MAVVKAKDDGEYIHAAANSKKGDDLWGRIIPSAQTKTASSAGGRSIECGRYPPID